MRLNFKAAWEVLKSKAYVLATEKSARISIPYMEPTSISNVMMLAAQQTTLVDMRDKLDSVIKEHEEIINTQISGKKATKKEVK